MDANQSQNQISEGVFDQDDKKRKLIGEIKDALAVKNLGGEDKKELLRKLNLHTAV
ncbi:MAG: hypothetical protein UV80_C0009G0035 [Candidatus Peregrinibacteria bacterium GW2011_GWF2_43_17]|nr:MAG: hypothetical protein UV80_C0009G0035 [Candidatus Peregrinibacteria bacterium GW2011_GWF2_43_17]KKT20660.1 MAG: hypothetical protein UW03_C0001G0030 [Candidatus Peregrinibacteria bacterium GW2011_GWA2_43_8]